MQKTKYTVFTEQKPKRETIMKRKAILLLCIALMQTGIMRGGQRWHIAGHHAVEWNGNEGGLPHSDHIEMSGRRVSVVYYWNVDCEGRFGVDRHLVFPTLRTLPDNTHASWMPHSDVDFLKEMTVNRRSLTGERVTRMTLDGRMTVVSTADGDGCPFTIERTLWPSTTRQAVCERYTVTNTGRETKTLRVPAVRTERTTNGKEYKGGPFRLVARTDFTEELCVDLKPGDSVCFHASLQGYNVSTESEAALDFVSEATERERLVDTFTGQLDFSCPDDTLATLFAMAKIRCAESIFDTPAGPMQSPGGESYYAAMWCNDQAEYINPFFPFLGYGLGNESAMTTWRCYLRLTNPDYHFMPWSIICGGSDTFGPFDRGDQAMLAYGASRYCLERGDRNTASEVWPLIEWCLEYCKRRINSHGVVASEADELEHRLPSGDANLCTSSLYYDALRSAAYLADAMGKPSKVGAEYRKQAAQLRRNIDRFFHCEVEGYDTYRYYEGNDKLRSWIAIPLTMSIYDRAEGTVKAMFSPQLWTENGMLSVSGDKIFWDRTTLYGLRGTFAAGYTDKGLEYLRRFSATRLLGEHVPYMVEAWPEGGQRHLSTENALYCRIFTEGLLGFRATGFRSFELTPQMPRDWDCYSFRNVYACTDTPMNIEVKRVKGDRLQVKITKDGKTAYQSTVRTGHTVTVKK